MIFEKINLEDYRTAGAKVFTGRTKGIRIRNESGIDSLINEGKNVEIIIPENIMSVNPSFLEELLTNVVNSLGKEEFFKRVKFSSTSKRYDIQDDLEEAVDRILRKNNALTR